MKHIKEYLFKNAKIIDIGAGTGRYSLSLFDMGFDVTAIELVKKNLSIIKAKNSKLQSYQGNALSLKKFKDNTFDITLMLGPMYHLFTLQDKITALNEAKRITKKGGLIFVQYLLTDYAIIRHAIMDQKLQECLFDKKLDSNYNIASTEKDLYSYVRLNEIDEYNELTNLNRVLIFSPDGPTDYIRPYINKLSEKDFDYYKNYVLNNSTRLDLLGASSHLVDVLQK